MSLEFILIYVLIYLGIGFVCSLISSILAGVAGENVGRDQFDTVVTWPWEISNLIGVIIGTVIQRLK